MKEVMKGKHMELELFFNCLDQQLPPRHNWEPKHNQGKGEEAPHHHHTPQPKQRTEPNQNLFFHIPTTI